MDQEQNPDCLPFPLGEKTCVQLWPSFLVALPVSAARCTGIFYYPVLILPGDEDNTGINHDIQAYNLGILLDLKH